MPPRSTAYLEEPSTILQPTGVAPAVTQTSPGDPIAFTGWFTERLLTVPAVFKLLDELFLDIPSPFPLVNYLDYWIESRSWRSRAIGTVFCPKNTIPDTVVVALRAHVGSCASNPYLCFGRGSKRTWNSVVSPGVEKSASLYANRWDCCQRPHHWRCNGMRYI